MISSTTHPLQKDSGVLHQFSLACECEWLETNGLGGWSSSTIIGCNTRRYHGLLVASTQVPTERTVLVSKMDEAIFCNGRRFELGTNQYGNIIQPTGHTAITNFTRGLFPQFTYAAGNVVLQKTIGMVQEENTCFIQYDVIKADGPFTLELLPLIAARYYHNLIKANDSINRSASFADNIFSIKAYAGKPEIFIQVPGAAYRHHPDWYYDFFYAIEKERGLDCSEDLFNPGTFVLELKEGDSVGIILSTENPHGKNAHELLKQAAERKTSLLKDKPADAVTQQLLLAADQFIVSRNVTGVPGSSASNETSAGKTVIAGYHWFTDWSRDTMISLPGLVLGTARYEDAKKILRAFASSASEGMLPNRFSDNAGAPEYNTVDGTLWYFIAIYKYLQATGDKDFVLGELLPVLQDIINWHYKGTRYNIHVDTDGLLFAGEQGQQLTWMDAKAEDWVVTPRMGKPVEIQALWYNALTIFAELLQLNNQPEAAGNVTANAQKTKQSFDDLFWYTEGRYLYDVIDENNQPDKQLRPNQLFAISLPFPLIEGEKAASVLQITTEQLYTPVGLRTLPANDPLYAAAYEGDRYKRDGAYHQGTVWSWLLGPYVDALIQVKGKAGKHEAKEVISNFAYHLNEACMGSISEVFDGDAPHHPRGCIAQAWGVAEVLRVITRYELSVDTTET